MSLSHVPGAVLRVDRELEGIRFGRMTPTQKLEALKAIARSTEAHLVQLEPELDANKKGARWTCSTKYPTPRR